MSLGFADGGGSGLDVGPLCQRNLDQVDLVGFEIDQVERHQRASDRLEPHGRVEIERSGQPGRRDGQVFFGLLHEGALAVPLRESSIGVGLSAFARVEIGLGQPVDFVKLGFRNTLKLEDRLVAQ